MADADAEGSSITGTGDEAPPPLPAQQLPQPTKDDTAEEASGGGCSRAGTPLGRTALEREVDLLLVDIEARQHSERGGDPLAALGNLDEDEEEEEDEQEEENGEEDGEENEAAGGRCVCRGRSGSSLLDRV